MRKQVVTGTPYKGEVLLLVERDTAFYPRQNCPTWWLSMMVPEFLIPAGLLCQLVFLCLIVFIALITT